MISIVVIVERPQSSSSAFALRVNAAASTPVAKIVAKALKKCAKKYGEMPGARPIVTRDGAAVAGALAGDFGDGAQVVVRFAEASPTHTQTTSPIAAAGAPPRVSVLLACHCDSRARADGLDRCLASLAVQDARICVSWHATTAALADRVAAIVADRVPNNGLALRREARLSQFEHYDALRSSLYANDLDCDGDDWLLFADDDDVSHPARAATFAAAAAAATRVGLASIQLPWAATGRDGADGVEGATDVDAGLRRGAFDVRAYPLEHWTCCCSAAELGAFLDAADPTLLRHRFCDVSFANWLRARARPVEAAAFGADAQPPWAAPETARCWLYFYTRHGYESHVEWLVTPTPEDEAIARSAGADPKTLVAMRRRAERALAQGAFAGETPASRQRKTAALCAGFVEDSKNGDPRSRALYQSLAAVVAEGALRTFTLPSRSI